MRWYGRGIMFFSRKIEPRRREFDFVPRDNITAQELAMVVQWLMTTSARGAPHASVREGNELEMFQAMPMYRHFVEVP